MCGIAGWLGPLPDGAKYAERVAQALKHRGPDAYGFQEWPAATLIHTRLSILDTSSAGHQPMSNEDGTIWTVFNGEIYNHHELRSYLEGRGHVLQSHSDTAVLPHLYEEEGADFVKRLRGMFAIAIYDTRKQTLLLARDRFGIKPLFYAPGSDRLAFASEIRALRTLPGIDETPNRQAVFDFAALLYIPAPATFYSGIRALEPGELVEAQWNGSRTEWKVRRYHHWKITPDFSLTMNQAIDRVAELVSTGVQRQMESDVPLGSLLSGGIDSSLVSVAAQKSVDGKLQTFNVSFGEKEWDETWAAVAVADSIHSEHHTLHMDDVTGTWEHITGLLTHAGQPYADTSLFATHAVCRQMRRHVTVALSGDGGDEAFGGYNFYWQMDKVAQWQKFLPPAAWRAGSVMMKPLARCGAIPKRMPQRLEQLAGAGDTAIARNIMSWVRDEELKQLCHIEGAEPVARLFEPQWQYDLPPRASRRERLAAQAMEINIRMKLPNDFLFKVDTASMKESLEVRVPMLDEDLFDFGLTLPYDLKLQGTKGKMVLRGLAERWLPHEVAHKPKMGFGIPVDTWCDPSFKTRLREELLSDSGNLSEFFRPEIYRPIIEAFCDGKTLPAISREGLYQRAIMLLSVHLALANA